MKNYKCIICENRFCSDDEIPYCNICGDRKLEEVSEITETKDL